MIAEFHKTVSALHGILLVYQWADVIQLLLRKDTELVVYMYSQSDNYIIKVHL